MFNILTTIFSQKRPPPSFIMKQSLYHRGEVTSFQSPSSGILRTRHPPSPSISVAASTSADDQVLMDMLSQSPPTCLFIRMELCKNETLRDLLAKCNKENSRTKKDMFDYFEQV